jgi:glycosyltransferase involved in cell wall biosynthesis
MRIGVDARELFGKTTGVGRYLTNLLIEWSGQCTVGYSFILYSPYSEQHAVDLFNRLELTDNPAFKHRSLEGGQGTLWEQSSLGKSANSDSLDVFFAPNYSAPLMLQVPFVLALHDVSYFSRPDWFRWREGIRRRLLAAKSAKLAHTVLTLSQFSRKEIVDHLNINGDRIIVTPLGASRSKGKDVGLRDSHLVLFAGSCFTRRRLPDLIRAFEIVQRRASNARLSIVGDNRTYPHIDLNGIVNTVGIPNYVSIKSWISDDDLIDLYRKAKVFAFLSEYEGFGLPPLEALAFGTPSVMLDTEISREVMGDAASFVPLDDIRSTAFALSELLWDSPKRTAILNAASQVLDRYTWADTASRTLRALEQAATDRYD